jgi:hypothetical protein
MSVGVRVWVRGHPVRHALEQRARPRHRLTAIDIAVHVHSRAPSLSLPLSLYTAITVSLLGGVNINK